MFNSNDHNRVGTQKEVGQCCNCLYNDHHANDVNHPCIICTNPKAKEILHSPLIEKQGFVYVAYSVYDGKDESGDLIKSRDFKNQLTGFPLWCPLKKE